MKTYKREIFSVPGVYIVVLCPMEKSNSISSFFLKFIFNNRLENVYTIILQPNCSIFNKKEKRKKKLCTTDIMPERNSNKLCQQ